MLLLNSTTQIDTTLDCSHFPRIAAAQLEALQERNKCRARIVAFVLNWHILYRKFYRYSHVDTLKQLYVAFIRPHLENATAVWDPHLSKDILELESVQRFACRVCTKSWDILYCDMLSTLNIHPLSERRKLLKMSPKIVHGFIDFPNAPLL